VRFEFGYLFGMALQTVPEPRKVARDLFALSFSRRTLWTALLLVLVLGTMLGVGSSMLFPVAPEMQGTVLGNPLIVAGAEAFVAVATVHAIYWLGRAAGGTGTFEQGLITVIWLNFVLLIIQTAVFVLTLVAPGLAAMLWMAGGVMGFWIMSHFITEAHGFTSALKVFGAILLTSFVAVAILSILLTLVGVTAGLTGEVPNV